MARQIAGAVSAGASDLPTVETRSNPDFLGEDVGDVVEMAVGLGTTAYVNDTFVAPVVKSITNGMGQAVQKLVDSVSTAVTAWAIGEGIKIVGLSDRIAGNLKKGGFALAGGKLISVVLPDFQISAKIPTNFAGLALPGAKAASTQTNPTSDQAAGLLTAGAPMVTGSNPRNNTTVPSGATAGTRVMGL